MKNTNCECCRTNSKVNWFSCLNEVLQMILLLQDHFDLSGLDLYPFCTHLCKTIVQMCIFGL